jgi:hypothetical protein
MTIPSLFEKLQSIRNNLTILKWGIGLTMVGVLVLLVRAYF